MHGRRWQRRGSVRTDTLQDHHGSVGWDPPTKHMLYDAIRKTLVLKWVDQSRWNLEGRRKASQL